MNGRINEPDEQVRESLRLWWGGCGIHLSNYVTLVMTVQEKGSGQLDSSKRILPKARFRISWESRKTKQNKTQRPCFFVQIAQQAKCHIFGYPVLNSMSSKETAVSFPKKLEFPQHCHARGRRCHGGGLSWGGSQIQHTSYKLLDHLAREAGAETMMD